MFIFIKKEAVSARATEQSKSEEWPQKRKVFFVFYNFAWLSFPLKKLGRPTCRRQLLLRFQLTSKWLGRVKGEEVLGNCGDDRNQVAQVDSDFNFVQQKLIIYSLRSFERVFVHFGWQLMMTNWMSKKMMMAIKMTKIMRIGTLLLMAMVWMKRRWKYWNGIKKVLKILKLGQEAEKCQCYQEENDSAAVPHHPRWDCIDIFKWWSRWWWWWWPLTIVVIIIFKFVIGIPFEAI